MKRMAMDVDDDADVDADGDDDDDDVGNNWELLSHDDKKFNLMHLVFAIDLEHHRRSKLASLYL